MLPITRYVNAAVALTKALVTPGALRSRLASAYWERQYNSGEGSSAQTLGAMHMHRSIPAGVELHCEGGVLRIEFVSEGVARVRLSASQSFPALHSYAVIADDTRCDVCISDDDALTVSSSLLTFKVSNNPCRLTVNDSHDHLLLRDEGGAGWEGAGVRLSLHTEHDRAYYGLGDRAFGINHRGRVLSLWNRDPSGGLYRTGTDPLYMSIPFFLSQRDGVAYGLFLDNTYRATLDLGGTVPNEVVYKAGGGELCYYVIAGPAPLAVLGRFADLTGHMELPPKWALGYHQSRWSYMSEGELRTVASELRNRSIPCDVLYLDIDHMDGFRVFTWDPKRFPNPDRLLSDLRANGFRIITILDPGVKVDPSYSVCADGIARDLFCKLPDGRLYSGPVWPGECYFPDYSDENVRRWWGQLYRPLLEAGVGGFWNDMNEPAIFPAASLPDAVQHHADPGPTDHRALHNVYGQLMVQASAEGIRRLAPETRPFLLSRSGYAGIQRFAANWTGDNHSNWEHLRLSIPMMLSVGMSGQPFIGADVGGFSGDCDGELLARWMQVGAFSPFFRNHNAQGNRSQEPYAFGDAYEAICRRYIEWRYRLLPYTYTAFRQASESGLPVARALALSYPTDRRVASLDDEYMFGDAFLVAPILAPSSAGRGVYLPRGGWYSFWSGEAFEGPNDIPAHAPLDTLPLYVRAGSVIPCGSLGQHTGELAAGPLTLLLFPGEGLSRLYEDDGETRSYRNGQFRSTTFTQSVSDETVTLSRVAEGEYAKGANAFRLVLRGFSPDQVRSLRIWLDGQEQPIKDSDSEWGSPWIDTGLFGELEIRWL